jgi:hypothetical protein
MVLCIYAKNPELSVRQPEATSLARAKGSNMPQYFQLSVYHDVQFFVLPRSSSMVRFLPFLFF